MDTAVQPPPVNWNDFVPADGGAPAPAVAAAPGGSTPASGAPPVDWGAFVPADGGPAMDDSPQGSGYLAAGAKLLPRALINAAGGIVDAGRWAAYGGTELAHKLVGTPEVMNAPVNSTGDILMKDLASSTGVDLRMDKDAGWLMKGADYVLPWVAQELATGGVGAPALAAARAAPTTASAIAALAKGVGYQALKATGNAAGAAGLGELGRIGGGAIGGDTGATAGGIVGNILGGGGWRAGRNAAMYGARKFANADAAQTLQAFRGQGIENVPASVLVPWGNETENIARKIPIFGKVIADTTDKATKELQGKALDLASDIAQRTGTDRFTAAATPGDVGQPLIDTAQQRMTQSLQDVPRSHEAVESVIGGNTAVEAQNILDEWDRQIAAARTPDQIAVLQGHKADLQEMIDRANPQNKQIPGLQQQANSVRQANINALNQYLQDQVTHIIANSNRDPITMGGPEAIKYIQDHQGASLGGSGLLSPAEQMRIQGEMKNNGNTFQLHQNMPEYDVHKAAQFPAPVPPNPMPVPTVPTPGTKLRWDDLKGLRDEVLDTTNEGTQISHFAGPARSAYTNAMADAADQVQPGLGANWRGVSADTAEAINRTRPDLSTLTGEARPLGSSPAAGFEYPGAKPGEDIGSLVNRIMRGGDEAAMQTLVRAVGPDEVAKAMGTNMSAQGFTGVGKNTVQGETFRPQQWATFLGRLKSDPISMMQGTAPGRNVAQDIAQQRIVGSHLGQAASANTLGQALGQAVALSKSAEHPWVSGAAMGGALMFRRMLKDPAVQDYIAGLNNRMPTNRAAGLAALARSFALGAQGR